MIPRDSALGRALVSQLDKVVTILLLPAFFAFTGMGTRIDLLYEPWQWLICAVIIVTAVGGKFGGTLVAARLTGLRWRDAAILGTMMNTRGLIGIDRSKRRAGLAGHNAHALCNDGIDGPGNRYDDSAGGAVARSAARPRRGAGDDNGTWATKPAIGW